jgi:hypothetical protein
MVGEPLGSARLGRHHTTTARPRPASQRHTLIPPLVAVRLDKGSQSESTKYGSATIRHSCAGHPHKSRLAPRLGPIFPFGAPLMSAFLYFSIKYHPGIGNPRYFEALLQCNFRITSALRACSFSISRDRPGGCAPKRRWQRDRRGGVEGCYGLLGAPPSAAKRLAISGWSRFSTAER